GLDGATDPRAQRIRRAGHFPRALTLRERIPYPAATRGPARADSPRSAVRRREAGMRGVWRERGPVRGERKLSALPRRCWTRDGRRAPPSATSTTDTVRSCPPTAGNAWPATEAVARRAAWTTSSAAFRGAATCWWCWATLDPPAAHALAGPILDVLPAQR